DALVPSAVPDSVPRETEISAFEKELAKQVQTMAHGPQPDLPPPESNNHLSLMVTLLLGALLPVRKLVGLLNLRFKAPARGPSKNADSSPGLAEDRSLEEFFKALAHGPSAPAEAPDSPADVLAQTSQVESFTADDPLREFFDSAPKELAALGTLFSAIPRAPGDAARQKIFLELLARVRPFRERSSLPELFPLWKMLFALEGLLRQLSGKAFSVTSSGLRTVAGALDLLEDLCVPGVNPDLIQKPPVRLLAVDDDALSRQTIARALKKVFDEPDLATDGQAALALAAKQSYDLIFLDAEMPGMDGFEACSKIHETVLNRTTPVVFVTRHSDFNARAKSNLSGGHDLIGKPFMAFEITLKALTLVLRARLGKNQGSAVSGCISRESARIETTLPPVGNEVPIILPLLALVPRPQSERSTVEIRSANGTAPGINSAEPPAAEFAEAFFTHAPTHLGELQNQLHLARNAPSQTDLPDFLGDLYVGVHSLKSDAERAGLQALSRLSSSLEAMLKKLLEKPKLCTPSTLDTAAAALDLLAKLCQSRSNPDLASSPVRLLVVDDDPMARRAIGGALQLGFGKPDSADSGEAALTLAAEKTFDLIFLDVMMPGIDGFTACSKIRESGLNTQTPVVFVTSQDNQDSRLQAAGAGSCGFIPKPVLSSQITLTAWTFVLGSRLEKRKPAPVVKELEEAVC
ncbi:MAG: hypothetical protein QOJ40_834, partial [Verrucomicrobiota bacterium]